MKKGLALFLCLVGLAFSANATVHYTGNASSGASGTVTATSPLNATTSGTSTNITLTSPLTVPNGGTNSSQAGNAGLQFLTGGTALLPNWNKALANVMNGSGNARVACLGDSTTLGLYDLGGATTGDFIPLSFCGQLTAALNSIGIAASNEMGFAAGGSTNTRIIFGSGWGAADTSLAGAMPVNSTTTAPAVFTPRIPVDTFRLWYPTRSGSGVMGYSVDSGAQTTINEAIGTTFNNVVVSADSLGMHTFNVARVSGANSWFVGVEAWDSTKKQIIVSNWGWNGATTSNWATATNPWDPANACGTFAPDLIILQLQINDENTSVALATYLANLKTIISKCKTGGHTDIIIMTSSHISPTDGNSIPEATQAIYANTARALALTTSNSTVVMSVPVIDEFQNLVSYAFQNTVLGIQASPGSYPVDLHLTASGYSLMTRDIMQVLIPLGNSSNSYIQAMSATTSSPNYTGYFANTQTGTGAGVYGIQLGASNTGYAGYFSNSATTGYGVYSVGQIVGTTTIKTGGFTVATLPSGVVGMKAYITDQLASCVAAGAALTGGGAVTCPVFYNGSAWVGD